MAAFVPPDASVLGRADKWAKQIQEWSGALLNAWQGGAGDGWEFVKEICNVTVSQRSAVCMRSTGTVHAPPRRLQMVLEDVKNTSKYDDTCIGGRLVEQLCDDYENDLGVLVGYVQMRTGTMFTSDRDFVFLQVSLALPDGGRAVLRHSIDHPDVPEVAGFDRSVMKTSGYVLSPHGDNASEVMSLCEVDFGGLANHMVGNAFVMSQVLVSTSLRARFSEMKDDVKGLTSRTKNLFSEKTDLSGDVVNESVIQTWVSDLVKAAGGTGVDGWEYVKEHDGVTIDKKSFGEASDILCVRGRATVPAKPDEIFSAVSDVSKAATYDNMFINGRTVRCVLQKGTTSMFLNWAAFQTGNPMFSDRDFCFLQVNQQLDEDSFVVLCRSVEDENVPEKPDYVRGDIWTTGYVIMSSGKAPLESSTVTYACALNLKGFVPKFISDILLQDIPLKLGGIRKFFTDCTRSAPSAAPTPPQPAVDAQKADKAPETARMNFLEGQEMDSGLVTPGRPLQQMYVPKSGADKALPKLAFDQLGPQTGGPKKKKKK